MPRLWRTLGHIIARQDTPGYTDNGAWVIFPGINSRVAVHMACEVFGADWPRAQPDTYFYIQADLDADLNNAVALAGPVEFSDDARWLTEAQVLDRLAKAIDAAGSARAFAQQCGVSPSYLCDLQHKRRALTPKILTHLGIERIVSYRVQYQECMP